MIDFDRAQSYFQRFARECRRGGSPLYGLICEGIAEDEDLIRLAMKRKAGQPPANILLAAVQFLLLDGADTPLAAYYPYIGGMKPPDRDAFLHFKAFCDEHAEELLPIIAARITNTNEVGRCAFLAPAHSFVANETQQPLALIEFGPSAGFNLNFDRYGYRYTNESNDVLSQHWAGGPLTVSSVVKSKTPPPLPELPPEVIWRIGLELNPVTIEKAETQRWLKALIWPERLQRFSNLEGALAIAADHPPPIRPGNALELLGPAIAEAPSNASVIVCHSFVTYQFTREMKEELESVLSQAAKSRDVWRVSCEGADEGYHPVELTTYSASGKSQRVLADTDPHGAWVNWHG